LNRESGRNKIRDPHAGGTHLKFFSKNQTKFTYLVEAKITKFELGWWSQANYSQNQTLFIVNYEGFLID
jgi:hypothetical protein